MLNKISLSVRLSLLALFFLVSGNYAYAATMYLSPDTRSVIIGQEFTVDLKIDASVPNESINSAQATIKFPAEILSAVSVDKQNSTFGFWLEEPVISKKDGTMHFIGGTTKGVAGSALQVLRIKFKATGAGTADLAIIDAAVTAANGKGTNVLSGTRGVSILVGTRALPSLPDTGTTGTTQTTTVTTSVEMPTPVTRIATPAKALPKMPVLRVPLYPDETRWYNRIGDVIVLWDIPSDVTEVSARISHVKDNVVGTPEKVLSNGKSFGILKEGIWYIQVRFKNNIGWGPSAYYKISLDTTVPLLFAIKIDSIASDNPSPMIRFETSDSLSGMLGYTIAVDGETLTAGTSTSMKLPLQFPGKHLLSVTANDLAGNSVLDSIEFEILPLPTPQIEFITKSVSQGEFVFASGKSVSGDSVLIAVTDEDSRTVFEGVALAGDDGHWDITIKESLAIGKYRLSATTRDDRGATSFPVVDT
ncbi:MAG: hypothetical protein Q7S52_04730, partial [bacterium]|nr:hypothetical protein [bacterium]